ncbi:hypothetical protein [Nonomuraea sp. JJY05]
MEKILGGQGRLTADPVPGGEDADAAVTRQDGQGSEAEVMRQGVVTMPP